MQDKYEWKKKWSWNHRHIFSDCFIFLVLYFSFPGRQGRKFTKKRGYLSSFLVIDANKLLESERSFSQTNQPLWPDFRTNWRLSIHEWNTFNRSLSCQRLFPHSEKIQTLPLFGVFGRRKTNKQNVWNSRSSFPKEILFSFCTNQKTIYLVLFSALRLIRKISWEGVGNRTTYLNLLQRKISDVIRFWKSISNQRKIS